MKLLGFAAAALESITLVLVTAVIASPPHHGQRRRPRRQLRAPRRLEPEVLVWPLQSPAGQDRRRSRRGTSAAHAGEPGASPAPTRWLLQCDDRRQARTPAACAIAQRRSAPSALAAARSRPRRPHRPAERRRPGIIVKCARHHRRERLHIACGRRPHSQLADPGHAAIVRRAIPTTRLHACC